jgi:hypothetical protein
MPVRPRPGAEVPALTAQIAGASNPGGTTAMSVCDRDKHPPDPPYHPAPESRKRQPPDGRIMHHTDPGTPGPANNRYP